VFPEDVISGLGTQVNRFSEPGCHSYHKLHFSFVCISFISSWSTLLVLILCSMLNEEFVHGYLINGAGFCQDLTYQYVEF
jgi:hypothetical protein